MTSVSKPYAARPYMVVQCRMPGDLYAKVVRVARQEGMSVTEFLSSHLTSSLQQAADDAPEFEDADGG